jgi:hypothetical protein
MSCLAGGSFSYGGGTTDTTQSHADTGQSQDAQTVADMAAKRRAILAATVDQHLADADAEAEEYGDEPISEQAKESSRRISHEILRHMFDTLVWHVGVKISVTATHEGGTSIVLVDRDLTRRLTIRIEPNGQDISVIRIGADSVVSTSPFDSSKIREYLKLFS